MSDVDEPTLSKHLEGLVPGHRNYLMCLEPRRRVYPGPKVLTTDSRFSISGVSYTDTPILVDAYANIIEEPSKWLIYLRTMRTARGTVLQYASSLCSFWRHLQQVARKSWSQVDDTLLQGWRNRMLANAGHESLNKRKRTINKKLYVVLDFYQWCQEHGYITGIIGVTPPHGNPYPIRLVEIHFQNRRRVTSHLLYKIRKSPRLPVPTGDEIDLLYVHLSGPRPTHHRNVLLAKWALDSGMRLSEVLERSVSELPTLEQCQKLKDADRMYWMPIVGKGETERVVVGADSKLTRCAD